MSIPYRSPCRICRTTTQLLRSSISIQTCRGHRIAAGPPLLAALFVLLFLPASVTAQPASTSAPRQHPPATRAPATGAPATAIQQSTEEPPAPPASDSASVAAAEATLNPAQLHEMIDRARQDWQVPGLAVAVVHRGQVVLESGFGVREVGKEEPVDEHTLFAIASNTKAFTATALGMLVDAGKLDWDDRVREHLPWFDMHDWYAANDMRVRDLLCHRSGLGTFSGDLLWWGTSYSSQEVLRRAAQLEPRHPFRASYGYSNLMFLAAGEVVASISDVSWQEFVRTRIFEPLGMQRTVCSTNDLQRMGNYATPHKTLLDRSVPLDWVNWDNMAAAGGIISSVHDMALWLQMLLDHGRLPDGQQLISEKQLDTLWQPHTPIPLSQRDATGRPPIHFRAYGLGWALSDYRGRKLIRHGGGYDGMYSQVTLIPEEDLGIVVLTNSMTSVSSAITDWIIETALGEQPQGWDESLERFWKRRKEFHERITRAVTPVEGGGPPSQPLEAYTVTYRCKMYGDATVTLEEGKLVLRLLPNPRLVADLTHLHYDTFRIDWRHEFAWFGQGAIQFIPDTRGTFERLYLDVPNDDMWFYELDFRRVDQSP